MEVFTDVTLFFCLVNAKKAVKRPLFICNANLCANFQKF